MCDYVTGDVIVVDLTCSCLRGAFQPNNTLFTLSNVQTLYLRGNDLTGDIPSSICRMHSLENLSLADNKLGDLIPPCLGNLSKIAYLSLSFNRMQGSLLMRLLACMLRQLPKSLANCTRLEYLSLFSNDITDSFPHWLRTVPLGALQLGKNNFHGLVGPYPLALDFPHLNKLAIKMNNFAGSLPAKYFLQSNLTYIDLSSNKFEGALPILPPTLEMFFLSSNRFTGEIPLLLCNSTILVTVELSDNSLTGRIPQCLVDGSVSVLDLYLSMNSFRGPIPETLSVPNNCSFTTIDLSQNHLGGKLPRFLANCSKLETLDLSNNELQDSFPSWLEALPSLYILILRSNKFHGLVNTGGSPQPFSKLQIFDLFNNNFHGAFPTKYVASFKGMTGGDEKRGNFVYRAGDSQIFYAASVIGKGNNLTGPIPYSFGNLTNLEWLDLSLNNLSGEIPGSLADLTSLAYLNLSMNWLMGPIPKGKQFNTFKSDSFGGNPGLCGFPLPRECGEDANKPPPSTHAEEEDTEKGSWIEWRAVPMGYRCGTAFGLSAGYIMLHFRRPLWLMRMMERRIYKLQRRARRTRGR
ncbi:receptor-like protein Cf-9 homolog [Punica granatum]|uniref:Receptor-like protein Cf-9 homolog n=1 Tax=Punica granatum TaxID=22663 RepID=A0A6P8ED61_PUNGR|nr:receptor-like protein Cf-9 homolog [Punica granatum]